MIRGYRDSPLHDDQQLRWDHHSTVQDNPRYGAPAAYRPFTERPAIRPAYGRTSIPSDSYPTTRIIVFSNSTSHRINPRLPQASHGLMPRFSGNETIHVPTENDDSKLTKEQQEIVLKKLKKEIYYPTPRTLARRVNLYYRDLNKDPSTKAMEKDKDEGGKSCAVCLEDFEPREEVMLTPCSHMFHEECIVPWVKNHGHCPVCRANFCERRENGSALNNSRPPMVQPADQRVLFSDELLSLIQAVDEAFPWRF